MSKDVYRDLSDEDMVFGVLNDHLTKNGLRKTPIRFIILKEIVSWEGHFDIESLYEVLHKKNYSLSKATVYNTMEILLHCKLITKHQYSSTSAFYEKALVRNQHDHIICGKCSSITEFSDDRVERVIRDLEKNINFKVESHLFYVQGVCGKCLKGDKVSK